MNDPSRDPNRKVSDLISHIQFSSLSGREPLYVAFIVEMNLAKYREIYATFTPGTIDDEIKYSRGTPALFVARYPARSTEYTCEILLRAHTHEWQAETYNIHVEANPANGLIERFSVKPPVGFLYSGGECVIDFELMCDPQVKYVNWLYGDEKKDAKPEEVRGAVQQRRHSYKKTGEFTVRIEAHEHPINGRARQPESREISIKVIDPKNPSSNSP